MKDRSTSELLAAWGAGEVTAFAILVDRHQGVLLRYARFRAGAAAEDVVQEALLRLCRKPPALPREIEADERLAQAHLVSWLLKVVRNHAMQIARSEARRRRRDRQASAPEAVQGGQAEVEGRDLRGAVEAAIHRLPDDRREAVVLRLLAGRSYRDIAAIMGRPEGTVAWLLSEGLKDLARALDGLLEPAAPRHVIGGVDTR